MSRDEYLSRLERVLGHVLFIGVTTSIALLVAGLALTLGQPSNLGTTLLHAGLIALMATPVMRVLVGFVEYAREGDWPFAAASLAVLGVIAITVTIALDLAGW